MVLSHIEQGKMRKGVTFVFPGGQIGNFVDFAAEISPFSVPATQIFYPYERKTIPFSSH